MSSSSPSPSPLPAPGSRIEGLRASVVIPTYHRPQELVDCLQSVLNQTVKPAEVIVIDDGALDAWPLEREFHDAGIRYLGHRKSPPGLTASRNAGIRLATGDIIFFLDDDVVLKPEYLERILDVYQRDESVRVGAVGGWILDREPPIWPNYFRYAIDLCILNSGTREGRVLPSGFCVDFGTTPFPIRQVQEVDFLPGGASSFRREVFREETFSESFRGYGLGEDKEFSRRVARKWRLVVQPEAQLWHHESPAMRYDKRRRGRETIRFRHRFFREAAWRGWWSWVFFLWALGGYFLVRGLIALVSFRRAEYARVLGMFEGVRDVVLGPPEEKA